MAEGESNASGSESTIKIQWYRSTIAVPTDQKAIVRGLGFTKLNQVVERPDTPSMRGMVAKVPHLIRIIE